jgi:hypothetical protein
VEAFARELAGVAYLLLPLVGGALVHGACMRQGWLAALRRPIDGGASFRGRPLFGASKTWRGPVTVALGASGVAALQAGPLHAVPWLAAIELVDYEATNPWLLGALAGFAAELAELPNSFVKRQAGVAPGGTARGPLAIVFYVWDQLDLLLGYWLVLAFAVDPTPLRIALSAAITLSLHPLTTLLGYLLGMRPTAR